MALEQTARLDSWKEIATYLGRDVSTVMRWEREKGLPVHRLPGGKRQAVFALREEIDAWMTSHPAEVPDSPAETHPPSEASSIGSGTGSATTRSRRRWLVAAGAAVLILAAGSYFAWRAPAPSINSLAVLPLVDVRLGSGEEEDYFAYAMTDALTTELSKIGSLRVTSLTSAIRFKDAKKPLPEIARELGVDAVVQGTVAREGSQVRITVQLIEAATDHHLWAESYQRELQNVLALQGEVARAIAGQVRATLTPLEETVLTASRPADPQAVELYLRGRFHLAKWDEGERRRGADYFRQASEADPSFAPAYAALSYYFSITQDTSWPKAALQARAYASRALELDPRLPAAHEAVALVKMNDWDWTGAEESFRRTLELEPGQATARRHYAFLLSILGRHDEAMAMIQRMKESDPLNLYAYRFAGQVYYFARRIDRALEESRAALLLDAKDIFVNSDLAFYYAEAGMHAESIEAWERTLALTGRDRRLLGALADPLVKAGRTVEARQVQREVEEAARRIYISPIYLAAMYRGLGEWDRTFEMLERAYRERHPYLYYLASPWSDPFRSDPRFRDLLRRMNLPLQRP